MKLNNTYYLLRHGEAESNAQNRCSSWPELFENHLTRQGKEQVAVALHTLKNIPVDYIFCSPLTRTQETAMIVGKKYAIQPIIDKRLREISFGIFNGKSIEEFGDYFKERGGQLKRKAPEGESYSQVQKRVVEFFRGVNKNYSGKTIIIVSHQAPLLLLYGYLKKDSIAESIKPLESVDSEKRIRRGEVVKVN